VLCQRQQRGGLPRRGSHLTSADGPADAAPQEVAPHHTTRLALRRTLYLSRSSASSRLGSLTQMKINCTQRNAHSVIKKNAIYALFGVWCFKANCFVPYSKYNWHAFDIQKRHWAKLAIIYLSARDSSFSSVNIFR